MGKTGCAWSEGPYQDAQHSNMKWSHNVVCRTVCHVHIPRYLRLYYFPQKAASLRMTNVQQNDKHAADLCHRNDTKCHPKHTCYMLSDTFFVDQHLLSDTFQEADIRL